MFICALFFIVVCLSTEVNTSIIRSVRKRDNILKKNEEFYGYKSAQVREAPCECVDGYCEKNVIGDYVCRCPMEYGHFSPTLCQKCNCGKESNCTFSTTLMRKLCVCKKGYEEINEVCKGTCNENPCENDGWCAVKDNDIECNCKAQFIGELCQTNRYDFNPCFNNPCKNDGSCETKGGEAVCICPSRFHGKYCESEECSPYSCKNEGMCMTVNGQVSCICKEPYYGERCEKGGFLTPTTETPMLETTLTLSTSVNNISKTETRTAEPFFNITASVSPKGNGTIFEPDIFTSSRSIFSTPDSNTTKESSKSQSLNSTDEMLRTTRSSTVIQTLSTSRDLCVVNPCRNGGICRMEGNRTRCYCTTPFAGELCENDPCSTGPCMNGGLCKIQEASFRCECRSPFSGRLCQNDPCSERPCENGGSCFVAGNTFKCICKEPFAGKTCDTDPCTWNPCKNGGICKIENEVAKCFCKDPFGGVYCDYSKEIDGNIIIFASSSALLVTILILISCMLCLSIRVWKMS